MTIRFKETKIRISFFFGLTVALLGIFDKTGTIFLCLLSGVFHEIGHLTTLILSHEKPKEIHVTPFGMRIERKDESLIGLHREILTYLAGPLVNFFLCVLFFVVNKNYFSRWISINLTIGLFNMLPCEPLDGAKILENLLKMKMTEQNAEKILLSVSVITVFPVAVLGFIILFRSRYNFSLLLISFYMIFFIANKKHLSRSD